MNDIYDSRIVNDFENEIESLINTIESKDIHVTNDDTIITVEINKKGNKEHGSYGYYFQINIKDIIANKNKEFNIIKKQLLKHNTELINYKKPLMSMKRYKKSDNELKEFFEKYTKKQTHKLENNKEFMLNKLSRWLN